jgi:hypothetical protein
VIISMTAFDRPEYLKPVLRALDVAAAAHLDETVYLLARVDPSGKQDEQLELLDNVAHCYPIVCVNDMVLGCPENTRLAVLKAFDFGQDEVEENFVLHMEEDFLISPDALELAIWMRDRYASDPDVLAVALHSPDLPASGEYLSVWRESDWPRCQVWGTWIDRWEEHIMPNWVPPDKNWHLNGWGVHWQTHIATAPWDSREPPSANGRWYQPRPRLSRVKHIGERGTHTTPANFLLNAPQLFAADVTVPEGEYTDR